MSCLDMGFDSLGLSATNLVGMVLDDLGMPVVLDWAISNG